MPDPSADFPSLSATCPTNNDGSPTKAALNGNHNATSPHVSFAHAQIRPTNKTLTLKSREAAVRAAKKEIAEKVRKDWTWPPTSPQVPSQCYETEAITEWRERDSDSEYSPPSPISNADPYRFDSPDSVAQPSLSKKRRRQQTLHEEMQWNDGLRTFVERRDVWAGAVIQPSRQPYTPSPPKPLPSLPPHPSSTTTTTPTTPPSALIPLPPPLLPPTNPLRATITPQTHPQIYDKIILRGQSPSIPINLRDVVHALVAGWKKDGEWPPRAEAERVGDGGGGAKRGVRRVKRVLGLGRGRGVDGKGGGEGEGR